MTTPPAGSLGSYLRNTLHGAAAAELLRPVADALAALLGTAAPGATAVELEAALDALPDLGPGAEPLDRNAGFAAAEFELSAVELDILLLALRTYRNRPLSRFCTAVYDVLGTRPARLRFCSSVTWTRCSRAWRPARACAAAG